MSTTMTAPPGQRLFSYDVPPSGVVTLTSTVPWVPAGAETMIFVSERRLMLAATTPNRTSVTPAKSEPLIVTMPPPSVGPEDGLTPVTTVLAPSGVSANEVR